MTLKYNFLPPLHTLNPEPHPSHGMDHSLSHALESCTPLADSQTLIQTGLWSGQDPSWPLFHYSVAQSLRKDKLSPTPNQRKTACMPSVRLYRSGRAINPRVSIRRRNEHVYLTEGTRNVAGQPTSSNKKAISASAHWYSASLLCHCSFSSHNPRNELLFQPRCSISPQGHWKTQYNYSRQRHGSKQRLVRIIRKCPQDIKKSG